MELNIAHFSSAKTLAILTELNQALNKSKSFNDFKQLTGNILNQYNRNYLRTEYNLAVATAQNAARYHRQMENAEDIPYLIYKTAGDSRVRSAHAVLHNKVFKKGDMDSAMIYPPNGFGCRCEMVETFAVPRGQKLTSPEDAQTLLRSQTDNNGVSEWDKMVKGGFNTNRGVLAEVFTKNQYYVKNNFNQNFGIKDNELKPYRKLKQSDFPDYTPIPTNTQQALDWYNSKIGANDLADTNNIRLVDYNNKPLNMNKIQFQRHLKNGRTDLVNIIEDILKSPDEVFFVREGTQKIRYIKYYKGKTMSVIVKLDRNNKIMDIVSWHEFEGKIDDKRTGILIQNSGKTK